jgi:hypothetical protein
MWGAKPEDDMESERSAPQEPHRESRSELTSESGRVTAFAVETDAQADRPAGRTGPESTAGIDPDLECVDNIPV